MHSPESQLRADLLLFIVTLLAAAGWIFSKEVLAGLPPLLFIGTRFLLAGVVLSAAGWRKIRALHPQQLGTAVRIGLLFSVAMALWIMGLYHATHVGEGAFIASLGIVLVPVIARWVFGDTPPISTWLALPVAVVGFGLLSLNRGFHVEPGQLFFLAAAVTFAFLFNFTSRGAKRMPAIALTGIQLLVVGLVLVPVSAVLEDWPHTVTLPILGWLLASALIATTLRFFIQVSAQGMTSPSHAAVIMMLEPVFTAIVAAFWFDESMSVTQFGGCVLIFLALVINRWVWVRRVLRRLLS